MLVLVEDNLEEIASLCHQYGVAKLELFGSASDGSFDSERSDIDFLVEFLPGQSLGPWMSHYFELRDRLADLLGRNVDLVMVSALKNPWFIREVNRTRKPLYAA